MSEISARCFLFVGNISATICKNLIFKIFYLVRKVFLICAKSDNSRKYDEVIPLLQKYDSEIISSFQILYNTGNDLTDAILSDKQKNADENIKITFEGSLANVPADNLEICVLFNNMIDIAFENVKKFCGNGKQIISLKAETRAGFLFCSISFPIKNEIKKAQNNVLHHNFAYKTLKNLAEKNGGKIETSLSDNRLAITTGWVINSIG